VLVGLTVCVKTGEVLAVKFVPPGEVAVRLWVPELSVETTSVACWVVALVAAFPMTVVPSKNVTVEVGPPP
jgi:hypothetical protein